MPDRTANYRQGRIQIANSNGTRVLERDICTRCADEFIALFQKGKK